MAWQKWHIRGELSVRPVFALAFIAILLGSPQPARSDTHIPPDDPAIFYSPYNWAVSDVAAVSINPGAYFRTMFAGNTAVLNFDAKLMGSPASQIWWRVDDKNWHKAVVASAIPLSIPDETKAATFHTLEVIFKSEDITLNRWNTDAVGTAVKFTGLSLDAGATVHAPALLPCNLLIFGDSIAEGVRTVGESAVIATDDNDSRAGWAYRAGEMLGCEVGVVGFGGQGYAANTAVGGVPQFFNSFGLIYAGNPRNFSPAPDLVVVSFFNDRFTADADVTADATLALNGILAATPSATKVVVLEALPAIWPANTRTAVHKAVTDIGSPRLIWQLTTGIFNTANGSDSLSVHPTGQNNQLQIAPKLAALLRAYLP